MKATKLSEEDTGKMKNQKNGHWDYAPILNPLGCLYLEHIKEPSFRRYYQNNPDFKLEKTEFGTIILKRYWAENKTQENLEENLDTKEENLK